LTTVGSLAASISDTHPRGKVRLVFLNTSDILLGKVLHKQYSPVARWPGQAKKSIQRNDILFSEIRPANGRWAFIDFDADDYVVSTKLMVIRSRPDKTIPRFLYHFLTSAKTTSWLQHLAESRSGTFPQITFDQIAELEIELPSLRVQAAITSFLDAIDDKIEVNHGINETLETIVQATFKDWFVQFGPTRAKMEGRSPYLAADTWALFPNRLDDDDKPEGWEASTIGREVDAVGGSTPSTTQADYWGDEYCWATPKDLSTLTAPVLLGTARRISKAGLSQIGSGLLPAGTVLLSSRAPIGYLAITMVPTAVNQGFIAMTCRRRLSNVFVWLWTHASMEAILQHANGSTFQEISKSNFRPIPVTVPSQPVLAAFDALAGPIFERIVANERESRTLIRTRDLLLPKLMAGEIRMRDAEKITEAAL